jgi:hypothetical protein
MNPYKKQEILQYIRRRGRLPTDRFGNVPSSDDLLVLFDLDSILSAEEQNEVKRELEAMIDAEEMMDQLRRVAS